VFDVKIHYAGKKIILFFLNEYYFHSQLSLIFLVIE